MVLSRMRKTVIEKLRTEKGMRRVDLASAAKISEKSLINYEARYHDARYETDSAGRLLPRPLFKKTQERIAEALGVPVEKLFKDSVPR